MAKIDDILTEGRPEADIISDLSEKVDNPPRWAALVKEYDPMLHPVMDRTLYPDVVEKGRVRPVTRIVYDLQKLAAKRMSELCYGIPEKRIYTPQNERQTQVAKWLEAIFQRNRIDSVNLSRGLRLFASCEAMTLWYTQVQPNTVYGFASPLKLRRRTFSPMDGQELYPLFDELGDMIALSVEYRHVRNNTTTTYYDTYTADRHIRWSDAGDGGGWTRRTDEPITLGKIPAVYVCRPMPVWEHTSGKVYEMEWTVSRNGNYLRKNSKPLFGIFADEAPTLGKNGGEKSEDSEFRSILHFPAGSQAQYITWSQAIESLKFQVSELRESFFTELQLPDWSYEKMSQQALSGESRKQLFIDSQMKVREESGALLEMHDREVNVVKAFLKLMVEGYDADIDALQVESVITPFAINDDKDTIGNIMTATGGKAIMSQREGVENLGWSSDPDRTMRQMQEEAAADAMEPTV